MIYIWLLYYSTERPIQHMWYTFTAQPVAHTFPQVDWKPLKSYPIEFMVEPTLNPNVVQRSQEIDSNIDFYIIPTDVLEIAVNQICYIIPRFAWLTNEAVKS